MAGRFRNSSPLHHAGHRNSARSRFDTVLASLPGDPPAPERADRIYAWVVTRCDVAHCHIRTLRSNVEQGILELP